jgi:ribosomal-protein-serine acetyltransferase
MTLEAGLDRMNWLGTPPFLSDGTVGIRRFQPEDSAQLFEATRESIDELCAWMVWCHPGYSQGDCRAFASTCEEKWEHGESYSFAIFDAHDETFLGSVGLSQINRLHNFANLGYWVRKSCHGRGVAPAAVRLVARHGFQVLGFNRLDIVVPVGNHPSQRVAEKAGAQLEGLLRNRLLLQGRSWDAYIYSLVLSDLEGSDP